MILLSLLLSLISYADNPLILNQPQVMEGLATASITVSAAGLYNVQDVTTVPTSSGVKVSIRQNGSQIYASPTLSVSQTATAFKQVFLVAANDVISVSVTSSLTATDSIKNVVKSIITFGQGI